MKRSIAIALLALLFLPTMLLGLLLLPVVASAATVSLAWDASVTPSVTGYKIYVSTTAGSYTASGIDVGKVLTYTVPVLAEGTKYYFVATAYNPGGESGYSNEVSTTTPWSIPLPPNMKPVVTTASALDVALQKLASFIDLNRTAGFPNTFVGKAKLQQAMNNIHVAERSLQGMMDQRASVDSSLQIVAVD
jgi:hypothetical protein